MIIEIVPDISNEATEPGILGPAPMPDLGRAG